MIYPTNLTLTPNPGRIDNSHKFLLNQQLSKQKWLLQLHLSSVLSAPSLRLCGFQSFTQLLTIFSFIPSPHFEESLYIYPISLTMKTYDVLIIGAGIMGTFHAYHALKKGLSVALFEKNHQPQGATVKNFGQVVPSGMNRKWQRIGRRSLEIYKEVQNQTDITVRTSGNDLFCFG